MEKHFAVIGDPIAHSLSPLMHNSGYRSAGIEAEYQRFQIPAHALGEAVQGLKALGYAGWNVTIPHKESILAFLDDLTPYAQKAGAVNTVKADQGKLIGHNTDGLGFVRSVEGLLAGFDGRRAVILGSGGAAKGICLALAERGMKIHILNRTLDKARELSETLGQRGYEATYGELKPGEWMKEADLLVQTTSVGLKNEPFPFSLKGIRPQAVVVDIIFRPRVTPFLKDAEAQGCQTLNGLGMLLYQGALAWEFWLGGQAPVDAMRKALFVSI